MDISLPFECVCGVEADFSVEQSQVKTNMVFSASCEACAASAFIRITGIQPSSEEVEYTVGIMELEVREN